MWALTPRADRDPHSPADDVEALLNFHDIDNLGTTQPEAMDGIIAWLEMLVSNMRGLTSYMHVSMPRQ